MGQLDETAVLRGAEYLAKAAEADEKARAASDPKVKQTWEAMAETWRQMAARVARLNT